MLTFPQFGGEPLNMYEHSGADQFGGEPLNMYEHSVNAAPIPTQAPSTTDAQRVVGLPV